MASLIRIIHTCDECDREFNMLAADQAAEWHAGHDCEVDA